MNSKHERSWCHQGKIKTTRELSVVPTGFTRALNVNNCPWWVSKQKPSSHTGWGETGGLKLPPPVPFTPAFRPFPRGSRLFVLCQLHAIFRIFSPFLPVPAILGIPLPARLLYPPHRGHPTFKASDSLLI